VSPYPPIERWLISRAACELTRASVRLAGRLGTESGVFWLGTRAATSAVAVVAKPVGGGVIEEPWQWSVAAELYAAAAVYAKPLGLSLLAVVHTHLSTRPPRMSVTDRTRGLQVPDALAVIIGSAGAERDPARWGWFAYGADGYGEVAAGRITLTEGPAEFVEITIGEAA